MNQRRLRLKTSLFLLCLLASSVPAVQANQARYHLGPGDKLEITVKGTGDECGQSEPLIGVDGSIQVPDIGRVVVSGLTTEGVRSAIRSRLLKKQIYTDPVVAVNIAAYGSQPVNVTGAVESAQRFFLEGATTLRDALAKAGGVNDEKAGLEVRLSRGDGELVFISLADLHGRDPAVVAQANLTLRANDNIYVPFKEQYCVDGAVGTAGCFDVTRHTTLLRAIAEAGGVDTATADRSKIQIQRDGEILVFSLDAIEGGQVLPPRVQGNDQVLVVRKVMADFCIRGAVLNPDCFEFVRGLTLSEAVAKGGGLDLAMADPKKIVLRRDGKSQTLDLEADGAFAVERGDDIDVTKASLFVTVGGYVKTAGKIDWYKGLTVVDAIDQSGGTAGAQGVFAGKEKAVTITSNGSVRTVNVKDIRSGRARDVPLEPGDKVFVPARRF